MTDVKYPNVTVKLTGQDGNAFMIIGSVQRELRRAKVPPEEVTKFRDEATSGDYNNVLRTCMAWVNIR
jgi:hypothetical protein